MLEGRDQRSMWIQEDGCKIDMDSYMVSIGSCFMVTWTIFKNHPLEVGLPQNHWETTALQTLTTVDLFYYNHVWRPAWIKIQQNSIWLKARSHTASHYTWGPMTTRHGFGGVLGRRPLDTFFWVLTILWWWLLTRMWSGPNFPSFLLCPSSLLAPFSFTAPLATFKPDSGKGEGNQLPSFLL